LFVPVISAATQARLEGYFRLEWKLAAQRTHAMADDETFLLPAVIDETRDAEARVPAEFKAVQWTRLPGGNENAAFCARVRRVLERSGAERQMIAGAGQTEKAAGKVTVRREVRRELLPLVTLVALVAAVGVAWLARRGDGAAGAVTAADKGAETMTTAKAAAAASAPSATFTEAQKLTRRARAVIDDDWMAGQDGFRLAEELGQKAVALDVADGEAWATLARVSAGLIERNYDASAARQAALHSQAERAIRLAPESVEAALAIAAHRFWSGSIAEAETGLREVLRRAPMDPRVVLALAQVLTRGGKTAEAAELRLNHPAFGGRDPRPLVAQSRAITAQSPDEAEVLVDRAQALAPTLAGHVQKLRIAMQLRGDLPAARELVQRLPAPLLLEDGVAAYVARLWLWLGDGAKALDVLRRAPREFFEEGTAFGFAPKGYLAGWALQIDGRTAGAQAEWRQAIGTVEKRSASDQNRPDYLRWRALLLAMTGQREEAEKVWRLVVDMAGSGGVPIYYEAEHLLALGRREEAIVLLQSGASREVPQFFAIGLRYNPWFASIRDDPRVQALIADGEARVAVRRAEGSSVATAAPTSPTKSIAVLPFANVGGDRENEAFSDGVTDELISVLGRVPGLTVKARTSSFFFKGSNASAREKAQKLGAAFLVDGSVRRDRGQVRITAQLIKAETEESVWTMEPQTGSTENMFAVQEKIAALIAKHLQLTLGESPRARKVVNPEAYRLLLLGRQVWNRRTEEGYLQAEKYFSQALALDPDFAPAYTGLADTRLLLAQRQGRLGAWSQRHDPLLAEIEAGVRKALARDPDLAEAHTSLGNILIAKAEPVAAREAFLRAIQLNPSYATAHHWLGLLYWRQGWLAEARASMLRAAEADPLSSVIAAASTVVLHAAGDLSAARAQAERATILQPDSPRAISALAATLWDLGETEKAVALARSLVGRDGTSQGLGRAIIVLGAAGRREEVERAMVVPGPLENILRLHGLAALGRWEEFFEIWNVDTLTVDNAWYMGMSVLDPIRNDPRFLAPLREADLLEAHRRYQAWRAAHPPEKPEAKR
jgi:TolB-like protein/Tfp pilus assembly protein PilF